MAAWLTVWTGVSNEKARRELGFSPQLPSWREGFRQGPGLR
jgi:hypothetical protein